MIKYVIKHFSDFLITCKNLTVKKFFRRTILSVPMKQDFGKSVGIRWICKTNSGIIVSNFSKKLVPFNS